MFKFRFALNAVKEADTGSCQASPHEGSLNIGSFHHQLNSNRRTIMKRSLTSNIAVTVFASSLILWLVSVVSGAHPTPHVSAQAQDDFLGRRARVCSLDTPKGTFGYSYSGIVLGLNIAATGPITFDGAGNLSATYNVNLGGKPFQGAFTGTYTVNADCTSTFILHLPLLGISTNGSLVIVNQGKELFFTGTDPNVAVTGIAKKL